MLERRRATLLASRMRGWVADLAAIWPRLLAVGLCGFAVAVVSEEAHAERPIDRGQIACRLQRHYCNAARRESVDLSARVVMRLGSPPRRFRSKVTGGWLHVTVFGGSASRIYTAWNALRLVGAVRRVGLATRQDIFAGYTVTVGAGTRRTLVAQEAVFARSPESPQGSADGHGAISARADIGRFIRQRLSEVGAHEARIHGPTSSTLSLFVDAEVADPDEYLAVLSVIQEIQSEAHRKLTSLYFRLIGDRGGFVAEGGTVWPLAGVVAKVRPDLVRETSGNASAGRPPNGSGSPRRELVLTAGLVSSLVLGAMSALAFMISGRRRDRPLSE